MKNRAKCKHCGTIIESKSKYDRVSCVCGEISIDGGDEYRRATFKNKENFLVIDDEGNEIIPSYKEDPKESSPRDKNEVPLTKPKKDELLQVLDEMMARINDLPQHAALSPVTHADFGSLLMLLSSIFRSD